MVKTILLTGATGFIGSHVLKQLVDDGFQVIVLKRPSSDTWRIRNYLDKVKSFDLDKTAIKDIFEKERVDCFIHLATKYVKFGESPEDLGQMIEANINLPSQILSLCVQSGCCRIINIGTFFEYQLPGGKINEQAPEKPYNTYASTKLVFNNILKNSSQKHGLSSVNLRLFSNYGEYDNEKLFHFLIMSLLNNKTVDFSPGEQRWSFTYVMDTVNAIMTVIKNFKKVSGYEVFNVGYNKTYSIKEIVAALEEISGKKLEINWGAKPYIDKEIMVAGCDCSKMKQFFGWSPKYNLKSGLKRTLNYYLNNNGK